MNKYIFRLIAWDPPGYGKLSQLENMNKYIFRLIAWDPPGYGKLSSCTIIATN